MCLQETYGRYAELLHKIDNLPRNRLPEDLKSQRDFMDFVCRSFASRLERRRNVLITSQRFFRLVSEVKIKSIILSIELSSIKKEFFLLFIIAYSISIRRVKYSSSWLWAIGIATSLKRILSS